MKILSRLFGKKKETIEEKAAREVLERRLERLTCNCRREACEELAEEMRLYMYRFPPVLGSAAYFRNKVLAIADSKCTCKKIT